MLNYGCDATREMAPLVDMPVSWFSAKTYAEQRRQDDVLYYLENGFIMRRAGETVKEVLDISKIKVPGIHNVENFMTAIALTWGFVSNRTIYDVARKFKGVEHRCELVRLVGGVKYYKQSRSTRVRRAPRRACVRSRRRSSSSAAGMTSIYRMSRSRNRRSTARRPRSCSSARPRRR